jgi:hypothetical protein
MAAGEAELVFRGEQSRAPSLSFRQNPAPVLPASFDVLVEQRFLRKYQDGDEPDVPILQAAAARAERPGPHRRDDRPGRHPSRLVEPVNAEPRACGQRATRTTPGRRRPATSWA